MKSGTKDRAASVRQRLMNIARDRKEDFQLVLSRYALERLLFRVSLSEYRDQFLLKGATLFQLWSGQPHRPTRDLDLLGRGDPSIERFEQLFRDVCEQVVDEDGLTFLANTVRAEQIKEEDEYQGLRVRFEARLGNARVPVQIDVGFGDAVVPGPERVTFPTLLEFPAPELNAYPRETVVAEKYQAMVSLGIANSRMKDFYDIWTLARQFEFQGTRLAASIQATFDRRRTPLPTEAPLALTAGFSEDRLKQTQWRAFLRKGRLTEDDVELTDVVAVLVPFLMPPTNALAGRAAFEAHWSPAGPWQMTA